MEKSHDKLEADSFNTKPPTNSNESKEKEGSILTHALKEEHKQSIQDQINYTPFITRIPLRR